MAEGMINRLIKEKIANPDTLLTSGPRERRGEFLSQKYGVRSMLDNRAAVKNADVVVLSIKPQTLEQVMRDIKGQLEPEAVILSIIAGVPIRKISKGTGHDYIVRAMPNTPARIGKGITLWTAANRVNDVQKELARQILTAMGGEIFVEDEKYLDMATALSGTGPAYVFMFMEAMVDAGVHLGFPRRIAEELVVETLRGSVEYYLNSSETRPMHLARLRNQVTSPGGTTAAAVYFLEKAGFRTAISRAIWAAYERSRELGKDAPIHAPDDSA